MNKIKESLPSKAEIFEYWKTSKEYIIIDWYEPSCWACGEWWGGIYDIDLEKEGTGAHVRKKIWNRVPLQRCHIVPKSLGGTNDLSNLFLMCKDCHDLAPNTKSRELFLTWAKSQGGRKGIEIKQTLDSFNLNEEEIKRMNTHMLTPEFKLWLSENVGLHWNQKSGGARLNNATLTAALVKFAREVKNR